MSDSSSSPASSFPSSSRDQGLDQPPLDAPGQTPGDAPAAQGPSEGASFPAGTDAVAEPRPQDDLFRYVNGTWLAQAQIPADRPGTGAFVELRDAAEEACRQIVEEAAAAGHDLDSGPGRIGALYAAFMDEDHLEDLGARVLEPEIAPVLAADTKEELARVLGRLLPSGFTGVVSVGVDNDLNDPGRYTTWVSQAGIGLPDESYYREDDQAGLRESYVAHVARMLDLAGLPSALAPEGADGTCAADLARRVMELETALARGHWDRVTCRDVEKMNNPTSWPDLVGSAPGFPWQQWQAGVLEAAAAADVEQTSFLQEAIVCQPDYLAHAAGTWEATSLVSLKAWAAWHVVHGRAALMSRAFVEENFGFYGRTLQGTDELRARWKRGVGLVEGCLGEALGELYVQRHFPASHKALVEELVARLIEAYRQSISSLDWMSQATRERALDKLSQFTAKIGYPVRWRDYSAVVVTPGDLLASVRSVEAADTARALRKLEGPVDREEWHMTPQTVNAYYNPTMNEIVFPAAILQPPFFDPDADDAVNYAGIGAVIGHEIGHGFDDQGSTFDGTGRVSDWWSEADREAFTQRTRALIDQYSSYVPAALLERARREGTPVEEVPHVNGALTIGENIGDLGGLGIALKAYRLALAETGVGSLDQAPVIDGMTGLQRFFCSWARIWRGKNRDDYAELLLTVDPHSPSEFRCNGIVRNVDAFYEAFDVGPQDRLWLDPQERVTIW
ncbi:peptidase M13 [Actinomyces sp. 2119]|uniref:M13 family metallopeptidase n=1 Tax=Actinomyces sp. 2119 TaxID=2321393 RepID=UPI000E6D1920|nr:M13-type metalloendopeptidase [Actinomyces sp. 2119]RJF43155.1 peptidase M13 [Actinomyces sp. 2119]